MMIYSTNDMLMCKVFPTSLVGPTLAWFYIIEPNSIVSFQELFVDIYQGSTREKVNEVTFFTTRIGRNKSLRAFMTKSNLVVL